MVVTVCGARKFPTVEESFRAVILRLSMIGLPSPKVLAKSEAE
jgi:hypothetical protein